MESKNDLANHIVKFDLTDQTIYVDEIFVFYQDSNSHEHNIPSDV